MKPSTWRTNCARKENKRTNAIGDVAGFSSGHGCQGDNCHVTVAVNIGTHRWRTGSLKMEHGALKLGTIVGTIVGTGKQALSVRALEHDTYSGMS